MVYLHHSKVFYILPDIYESNAWQLHKLTKTCCETEVEPGTVQRTLCLPWAPATRYQAAGALSPVRNQPVTPPWRGTFPPLKQLEMETPNHTHTQTHSPDTSPFKHASASLSTNTPPWLNTKFPSYSWALHRRPAETSSDEETAPRTHKASPAALRRVIFRAGIHRNPPRSPRKAHGEACECCPPASHRTAAEALVRERQRPRCDRRLLTACLRQPPPWGGSPQGRPRRSTPTAGPTRRPKRGSAERGAAAGGSGPSGGEDRSRHSPPRKGEEAAGEEAMTHPRGALTCPPLRPPRLPSPRRAPLLAALTAFPAFPLVEPPRIPAPRSPIGSAAALSCAPAPAPSRQELYWGARKRTWTACWGGGCLWRPRVRGCLPPLRPVCSALHTTHCGQITPQKKPKKRNMERNKVHGVFPSLSSLSLHSHH